MGIMGNDIRKIPGKNIILLIDYGSWSFDTIAVRRKAVGREFIQVSLP
jgi:hypothetical protein